MIASHKMPETAPESHHSFRDAELTDKAAGYSTVTGKIMKFQLLRCNIIVIFQ